MSGRQPGVSLVRVQPVDALGRQRLHDARMQSGRQVDQFRLAGRLDAEVGELVVRGREDVVPGRDVDGSAHQAMLASWYRGAPPRGGAEITPANLIGVMPAKGELWFHEH